MKYIKTILFLFVILILSSISGAGQSDVLSINQLGVVINQNASITMTNKLNFANPPTINVTGIPYFNMSGTNGQPWGSNSVTMGVGNWYYYNDVAYFQSYQTNPMSFDLLPGWGCTNTANIDLCAWWNPTNKMGQYADIGIHPNTGGTETMWVGGIGVGGATPGLWLDSGDGGITVGANAWYQMGDYVGYQSIHHGFTVETLGNFTTYGGFGSTIAIGAGGVDANAVGWLAWNFTNDVNHILWLVPNGGSVNVGGNLSVTNGTFISTNGQGATATIGIQTNAVGPHGYYLEYTNGLFIGTTTY